MKSFVRLTLFATSALVSAPLVAVTASAQQAADPASATPTPIEATTSGSVNAPTPDNGNVPAEGSTSVGTGQSGGGEIIVTARRRRESAQDVPLAISVIGGDHIDNTGAFNVGRLQQLTPTLQFYSSNPRNTSLTIRGIGAPFGLTNDGFEQGVGIYVDDVYYSRAASATFDFLDIAQIEVLRGPQGTLYGKNTTAGAINITSRQPTFDFEGRAEATLGNLDFRQFKGAISGPITSNLAARFAVSSTSRRGTLYNVTSGRRINAQDNLGLRLQVLWKPTDTIDVTLAGDYNHQDPSCCGTVFARVGTTQRPLNRQYNALALAQGYEPPSRNGFDRLADIDAPLEAKNKIGGASLRVKWNVGGGTLSSITAWRFWDWTPQNDRDYTGLPITTRSQNPSQQNQYTQELRYNFSGPKFDFVVGAFGYYQTVRTQGTEQLGSAASRWLLNPGTLAQVPVGSSGCGPSASNQLACDPSVLSGVTASNDIRLNNTSAAIFGQFAYKVTDKLTVQPGVRLNYDKKTGLYQRTVVDGLGRPVLFNDPVTGAFITDPRVAAQRDQLTPQRFEPRYSAKNFSYDLNVNYKFRPGLLVYGTYAKTFKSGGVNLNGVPNDAAGNPQISVATIKPERVQHFEAGIKTEFLDRRAIFNLSAFRTDIRNFQALVNSGQVSTTRGYLANAEKVRTQGIEADLSLRPSSRFNLYVNGAFTDAKYRKFTGAPCPPELSGGTVATGAQVPGPAGVPGALSPASCDISGQVLPGVSRFSASFGAEYNIPTEALGTPGQVYFGYDGNARTRFSSNPSASGYTYVGAYSLSNFRVGFRTDSGVDVFGWVRNAFDQNYYELLTVAPGSTGLIAGQPGDPRTFGGTVKVVF